MSDGFTKTHLRDLFRQQRVNVELTEIAEFSHAISERLLAAYDWKDVQHVLSYAPVNHELDPTIFENQLKAAFPQITIEHVIASPEALRPQTKYDVILVPCLAADREKNRLGNGGGWYDQFLNEQPQATSIGLVYDNAFFDAIPVEDHDVPLNVLVTPTQTIK